MIKMVPDIIKFDELNKIIYEDDWRWWAILKNAHPINDYNAEGAVLYLCNTYKLEYNLVNELNNKKDGNKYEHTDDLWDCYYPGIYKANGPDIKVTTPEGDVYYIELKHFYNSAVCYKTIDFYCCAYKKGINFAKAAYGNKKYVADYKDRGYNTRYMVFCDVDGDTLYYTFVDTTTGDIVKNKSFTTKRDFKLWYITDRLKKR